MGEEMAKFLWEQQNPLNFDLYTPEEVMLPACTAGHPGN